VNIEKRALTPLLGLAALFLVDAGFSLYRLTRDLWTQPLRLVMIGISAMWLAVGFYLMSQPQLMSLPTSVPQPVAELEPLINNRNYSDSDQSHH